MHLAYARPIRASHVPRKGADIRFSRGAGGGKNTLTCVPKLRADAHPPPCRAEDRRPRMKSPRPARAISSDASPAPLNLACESRRASPGASHPPPVLHFLFFPSFNLPFVFTLTAPTASRRLFPPAPLPAQLRRELPEGLTLTPWPRKAMPPAPTSRPTPCAEEMFPMAKARLASSVRRPKRRPSRR